MEWSTQANGCDVTTCAIYLPLVSDIFPSEKKQQAISKKNQKKGKKH